MIPKAERQTVVWIRRPKTSRRRARAGLSGDECANVQRAVRFLARRHGSVEKLAGIMGMGVRTLERATERRSRISAAMVLRIARFAGVGVDELLAGKFPKPGTCPLCGYKDTRAGADFGTPRSKQS